MRSPDPGDGVAETGRSRETVLAIGEQRAAAEVREAVEDVIAASAERVDLVDIRIVERAQASAVERRVDLVPSKVEAIDQTRTKGRHQVCHATLGDAFRSHRSNAAR